MAFFYLTAFPLLLSLPFISQSLPFSVLTVVILSSMRTMTSLHGFIEIVLLLSLNPQNSCHSRLAFVYLILGNQGQSPPITTNHHHSPPVLLFLKILIQLRPFCLSLVILYPLSNISNSNDKMDNDRRNSA